MEDETMFKHLQLSAKAAVSLLLVLNPLLAAAKEGSVTFDMVVSGGAKACLPNATGRGPPDNRVRALRGAADQPDLSRRRLLLLAERRGGRVCAQSGWR